MRPRARSSSSATPPRSEPRSPRRPERRPGDAGFLYNLACAESRLGRKEEALEHLRQSVEAEERFKQDAAGDPDFNAIRDDPKFSAITGQAGSAGTGS